MSDRSRHEVLDDYDRYADVDQALLRGEFPDVFSAPRVIGIAPSAWPPVEVDALVSDIIALRPQYAVPSARTRGGFAPWDRLAHEGIEWRARYVVVEDAAAAFDYASLLATRLILDLTGIPTERVGAVIDADHGRALALFRRPVTIVLPVEESSLDALDGCLSALGRCVTTPARIALDLTHYRPTSPSSMQRLAALVLRSCGSHYVTGLNPYRLARLHLYYRLPLLRMDIRENGDVLPLASFPVRLGTLRESRLPEIWRREHARFWQRPDVHAASEAWYRVSDMAGPPA